MNANALRALSRAELQKLARVNSIKANQKTDIIIALLVERHATGVSPSRKVTSPLRRSQRQRSNSLKSPVAKAIVKDILKKKLKRNPVDGILKSTPPVAPHYINTRAPDYVRAVSEARSECTFGTPESSREATPEQLAPTHVLEYTVRMMAEISEQNRKNLDEIVQIRDVSQKLRKHALKLRATLRAEQSRRDRLQNYLTYWRNITDSWEYEATWAGSMRVTGNAGDGGYELSSDEEEPEFVKARRTFAAGLAATVPIDHGALVGAAARVLPAAKIEVNAAPANKLPLVPSTPNTSKRPRASSQSESEPSTLSADAARYQPRRRLEETSPATGAIFPAPSPTKKILDKGKGRMSAEEVERLVQAEELARSHSRDQRRHEEEGLNTLDVLAALGLTAAQVEEDRAAMFAMTPPRVDYRKLHAATPRHAPAEASSSSVGSSRQHSPS